MASRMPSHRNLARSSGLLSTAANKAWTGNACTSTKLTQRTWTLLRSNSLCNIMSLPQTSPTVSTLPPRIAMPRRMMQMHRSACTASCGAKTIGRRELESAWTKSGCNFLRYGTLEVKPSIIAPIKSPCNIGDISWTTSFCSCQRRKLVVSNTYRLICFRFSSGMLRSSIKKFSPSTVCFKATSCGNKLVTTPHTSPRVYAHNKPLVKVQTEHAQYSTALWGVMSP
mmetsp:Transcript_46633/g.134300  ORF Transcript_46633/g.134300 Transcript_46633/m.134300 type:complete len:226 (+) Transcript_46633:617-1294(+)